MSQRGRSSEEERKERRRGRGRNTCFFLLHFPGRFKPGKSRRNAGLRIEAEEQAQSGFSLLLLFGAVTAGAFSPFFQAADSCCRLRAMKRATSTIGLCSSAASPRVKKAKKSSPVTSMNHYQYSAEKQNQCDLQRHLVAIVGSHLCCHHFFNSE